MLYYRHRDDRGAAEHGWLSSRHTFSFANYHDPRFMGFRVLRVINEDKVQAGAGFPTHPHKDMEIITYLLDGALEHKDSMGNGTVIRPGEVQIMSAGTGIQHSEFNPSDTEGAHLLQMWVLPGKAGLKPRYDQKAFPEEERRGRWRLVLSPQGEDGSLVIHQDVKLFAALIDRGQALPIDLAPGRHGWLQVARGAVRVNGSDDAIMSAGDGLAIAEETRVELEAIEDAELLFYDLP